MEDLQWIKRKWTNCWVTKIVEKKLCRLCFWFWDCKIANAASNSLWIICYHRNPILFSSHAYYKEKRWTDSYSKLCKLFVPGECVRRRAATRSCFLRKSKEEESRLIVADFNPTEPLFQRAEPPFCFQLQRSCCWKEVVICCRGMVCGLE